LQVVPFGRAFTDGRDTLFYDLAEMRPFIQEALAFSKKPDVHIWMNRFPPQHLEGYEHLIQDPYKLNDEVRGRKEEYARLLDEGQWLDCREPARCKYCYLERLCDTLETTIATVDERRFDVVRVDAAWEAKQPPVYGGDPASARRSKEEALRGGQGGQNGKRGLPLFEAKRPVPGSLEAVVHASQATTLHVCAPDVAKAMEQVARFPKLTSVDLELESYGGLAEALAGPLKGRTVGRVTATTAAQATALLAIDAPFEVDVVLTRETAAWVNALPEVPSRVALRQPNYERLTEAAANDVELRPFFADLPRHVPVENVPPCILGREPRKPRATLDTAMMTPDGRLEIFRYTRRYILEGYRTKSLRCVSCVHFDACDGMHVNYVRAHGYGVMEPVGG
ncbi:MAG: radical SAM protein, partial [Polyangiaceae bacterium]